jgi:UPF0755 protein
MLRRVALVLLIVVICGAAGAFWIGRRLATPYRGFSDPAVYVELPPGTSEREIARRLTDAGVVPDELTFRIAVRLGHAGRRLQAGEYRFEVAATPGEVVARLARGDVDTQMVTFPEGLTVREMASIFERSGLGTANDFEQAASAASLAASFDAKARTLEGYLFPSTYALHRRAGADGAVAMMLAQFQRVFDPSLQAIAAEQHVSIRQVITLASIIEKETAQANERPLVSAVIQNRLKIGMPLQCDPTVIYALMLANRWDGNITKQDLQIDSPYNTYRYPGLPPGPIASPGRSSIVAALHPADVSYLYFVSRNDGTHVFASTLDEHNRNVAQWQSHLRPLKH